MIKIDDDDDDRSHSQPVSGALPPSRLNLPISSFSFIFYQASHDRVQSILVTLVEGDWVEKVFHLDGGADSRVLFSKPPEVVPYLTVTKAKSSGNKLVNDGRVHALVIAAKITFPLKYQLEFTALSTGKHITSHVR